MKPAHAARARRTLLLLVEDSLTTRCLLEQHFLHAGCDVLQAVDPDTALMRLKAASVDMVILDLRLGEDRSGLEVLEQLRLEERYVKVPVVILTAANEVRPEEKQIIDRLGAHLLYKWQGYREILHELDEIVGRHAAVA
jgi:DNA-binding response OmpR family regulator